MKVFGLEPCLSMAKVRQLLPTLPTIQPGMQLTAQSRSTLLMPADTSPITADLTIEPGVEVIVGEGKGISFDGGLQADGNYAQFTAVGSGADRITFNADRTVNSNALWHGLATDDN